MKLVTRDGQLVVDPQDESLRAHPSGLARFSGAFVVMSSFRSPQQQRLVRKELFGRSFHEKVGPDVRYSALSRSPAPRIPRISHSWIAGSRHLDALASPASIRASNWLNTLLYWAPGVVLCVLGLAAVALWTLRGPEIVAQMHAADSAHGPQRQAQDTFGKQADTSERRSLNPILSSPAKAGASASP